MSETNKKKSFDEIEGELMKGIRQKKERFNGRTDFSFKENPNTSSIRSFETTIKSTSYHLDISIGDDDNEIEIASRVQICHTGLITSSRVNIPGNLAQKLAETIMELLTNREESLAQRFIEETEKEE